MSKRTTTKPEPAQASQPAPAPEEERNMAKEILSWVQVLVTALIMAWFLVTFILVNATVPSGSMQDTIQPGDRLFGLRLTYLFTEPKRGDIVVFHYPVDDAIDDAKGKNSGFYSVLNFLGLRPRTNYIKRIIGLPGETVEIKEGKIYIDGSDEPLNEDYLKEEWVVLNDGITFHVPEGCYLMLGDNRNNSSDSRYWAHEALRDFPENGLEISAEDAARLSFVRKDQILGKAYLRYWPLNTICLLPAVNY